MSSDYIEVTFRVTNQQHEKLLEFVTAVSMQARKWVGRDLPILQRALVRLRSALEATKP